jgi:hypothetical protein
MQVPSVACRKAVKGEELDFVTRGSVVAGVCTSALAEGIRNSENDRPLRVTLNPSVRLPLKHGRS